MPRVLKPAAARKSLHVTAALAIAGVAVVALSGIALATTFTLKVSKGVHVTNQGSAVKMFAAKAVNKHEAVAVGPSGFAVYTFQGETAHHIICKKAATSTGSCWAFWPPVSVKSAKGLSAQTGIKGKLGTFMNQGTRQLTLGGKPLYYFTPDLGSHNKKLAQGDELKTFGSIWHIVTTGKSQSTNSPPAQGGLPPGY
jgi:predicted lipoprotein with Yx(FWY)xxD motif